MILKAPDQDTATKITKDFLEEEAKKYREHQGGHLN